MQITGSVYAFSGRRNISESGPFGFPDAPESVHLTDFPVADPDKIDKRLSVATQLAIKVSSLGRAARSGANIKVRQPLANVVVAVKSKTDREGLERLNLKFWKS